MFVQCVFLPVEKLNGSKTESSNYRGNIQTPTSDNAGQSRRVAKTHNHVGKVLKMR